MRLPAEVLPDAAVSGPNGRWLALVTHTAAMLLGNPEGGGRPAAPEALSLTARAPLITALVAVGALGITAWPISSLIATAAQGGHP